MKILSYLTLTAVATAVITSCGSKQSVYTLNGEAGEDKNDAKVLLISFNNGDTIGETAVSNGKYTFTDTISSPIMAQVRIGGRASGIVILEDGIITLTPDQKVSGTPLNDVLAGYFQAQRDVFEKIGQLDMDTPEGIDRYNDLVIAFNAYEDSLMRANIGNPVGASILINNAYDMDVNELESFVAEYPSLANYSKLSQIIAGKNIAAETSVGKPYKDFEIEYEGTITKLSDLMKPGRYTLVDFWASWCGPCRREMPVIKELLQEYGPKGLDVVGVAVWDEPDATKNAMEELEISWPVIINAGKIPTDLYGIMGIPTIVLIAPDGTIVSRGQQDDDLRRDVANAIDGK